jgi:hypothetical protein
MISKDCEVRETAEKRASPLAEQRAAQGKLVEAVTTTGTPGSVTPKCEMVIVYAPLVVGFHTTRYVPSSLSRTRARTTAGPRMATKKESPPFSLFRPRTSCALIQKNAWCMDGRDQHLAQYHE